MLASIRQPVRQLPLVPTELLRAHDVHEKHDTRFRACARLLQALWRQAQDLPEGRKRSRSHRAKPLGSRLHPSAGQKGRNFLTPAIAEIAQQEMIYQESGALIDRERLANNLLSSMPLAFNLGGPWRVDPDLAASVLRPLLPNVAIERVVAVWFEHSPGRLNPALTGDRTAFDIAVVFERPDGKRGLIGFEIKYSENANTGNFKPMHTSFDELARASNLYKEPNHAALRVCPLQQLFREHLLAYAALRRELYAEVHFVLVAPRHNHLIERLQSLYEAFLVDPRGGPVPYHFLELEAVIAAFAAAGDEAYAGKLFDRYCDWSQLDLLIEKSLYDRKADWSVSPISRKGSIALVARAA